MKKLFVGIDYSMSSPAVTVFDGGRYYVLCLGGKKKQEGKYSWDQMEVLIKRNDSAWKNNIERYSKLSLDVVNFINSIRGENPAKVLLEGYSFGSSGSRVFNIAENTQTLKLRIYNTPGLELLEPASPPAIKKFATDKGNANKDLMCDTFLSKTGINLTDKIDCKPYDAPINDIVDSYWICQYCMSNYG